MISTKIIILVLILILIVTPLTDNPKYVHMLNVYNEPLGRCRDSIDDKLGSWDSGGRCSELGGGVHQICYRNIANNANRFSENTGQTDWSSERGNNNHCVCLGAWSLYKAKINQGIIDDIKGEDEILKCDAIPNIALSKNYVDKFSKWNNNELDDQIIDGVEGLVEECGKNAKTRVQYNNLIDNYCEFAKGVGRLENSKLYKQRCL